MPEIRIGPHPATRDRYGLPVPVPSYSMHPDSDAAQAHANRQTAAICESPVGDVRVQTPGPVSGCHNMGTARISDDPGDGMTHRWGQAHEGPKLFVSDGSLVPTSAAANPTLTIVALAIRQADRIAGRMARREL